MLENINVQALVDIVFAVIVVAVCLFNLSSGSQNGEKRANKWREELLNVQNALRELIEDASIASNNLDRRLLGRKEELEVLLGKIEQQAAQTLKTENNNFVELPNSSWLAPVSEEQEEGQVIKEAKEDTEELTAKNQSSKEVNNLNNFAKALNQEIETVEEPLVQLNAANFANQLDPTTYKIAKRLVAEGHEVHVIARKLELPLAQVRLLMRIISNELKKETQRIGTTQSTVTKKANYGFDNVNVQVVNGDY